ncbi:MAG: efflux RND transporter permease subunit [Thermodesulfobacteriota bacterium]
MTLLLAFGLGPGITKLGLNNDYRTFFSDDNPDLNAFDSLENTYTKNDNVLILIHPKEGDVFNKTTLGAIYEITEDSWQTPYSTRVDSISNFQHTWADGDNLIVEDLIEERDFDENKIQRAKEVSIKEPFIYKKLLSEDLKTAGINVRIQAPGESVSEVPEVAGYVRGLRDKYQDKYPDQEIRLVGVSMMNNAFAETPQKDFSFVMPLMFAVFSFALIFFLRSIIAAIITFILVIISTISALGTAGYLGIYLDPVSAAVPNIILTLAVADAIHILVTFFHELRQSKSKTDALKESFQVNVKPVFLTSITTAIGFLSLNFSDSPPFRLLGNLTAFGVMTAWFYSMTFLPAIVSIMPLRAPSRSRLTLQFIDSLSNFVIANYKSILIILGTITLVLILSISRLQINDRYHEYFSKKLDIRNDMEFSIDNLTGVYLTSFSIESDGTNGVSNPEYLKKVSEFTDWLKKKPEVSHVNTFSDTMKRLNMNLNGDDPSYYRLPESQELGAQYLLLYEMSLPYGLDVNDQINIDKSSLRIDVTYGDPDLRNIEASSLDANRWLRENGLETMKSNRGAGTTLMFANITRRNIDGMIVGTSVGFALIALIMMIALRSVKIGLLSLIPNILPAAMAFGIWAIIKGEIGFAITVVASISIGIIIDDTVHFLSKYYRARKDLGFDTSKAIKYAFETVGTALTGTSFIIAAGFLMLGLSTFRVTAYMGLLTAVAIICALITDFLLLPALLMAIDKKNHNKI